MSQINLENALQEMALGKVLGVGIAESKFSPLYWPLKGWKNLCTSTQFFIQCEILGVGLYRAHFAVSSQAGRQLWRFPATKVSGS